MKAHLRRSRMEDCVAMISAGRSVNGHDESAEIGEKGVLKTSSVSTGQFRPSENKRVLGSETALLSVPVAAGTIILGRSNTIGLVGASALVREDHRNLFLSDKLWAIQVKGDFDPGWMHAYLSLPRVRAELRELASGSSAGMKNISRQSFRDLTVLHPPLPEQRKIADILGAWDDAIGQASQLLERKAQAHRARSISLIASTKHGSIPLGRLVAPVTTKNLSGETRVLTSSARHGLVDQQTYFNRTVAGANLADYYLLEEGDFAYNRSASTGSPYGAIRRLTAHPRGVISTLYLCFRVIEPLMTDRSYLDHLFKSNILDRQLVSIVSEGARAHGLLNISRADFLELTIPLPSIEDQQRIAAALDASSEELTLLDRQVALLKEQKRGLMQKLLTGDIRVAVDPTEEVTP